MFVKQISVFLENKKGRLAEVTGILASAGINIRALSLADMADFGVLRLIVNDRPRCLRILREHDLVAQETDVIAVEMEDRPGGLHRVVEILEKADINIEYMYAFFEKSAANAVVVFKIDDSDSALAALRAGGIVPLSDEAIASL